MRIIGERKAVVANVLRRIDGLGHRANGNRRNQVGFRLPLHLREQLIDVFRYGLFTCTSGLERIAKSPNKLTELQQLILVRKVVNAIHKRLLQEFAHMRGYRSVGEQHKLLNQLIGIFRGAEIYA